MVSKGMSDLKEDLDLSLDLSAGVECEMPRHKVDGVLGMYHDDSGAMWQVHTFRPCCPLEATTLVCDKVHTLMLTWLDDPRYCSNCLKCGKRYSYRDMYVKSVRWG